MDFSQELLKHEKWHEKDFIKEQLLKHLAECAYRILDKDPHANAELIDLLNIAKVYLKNTLSAEEIKELTEKRFAKFVEKLENDKKWFFISWHEKWSTLDQK